MARTLRRDLARLAVGVLPGAGCDAALHRACVDKADLQQLLRMRREFANRGAFHRVYPVSDGARFADLLAHMHGLACSALSRKGEVGGVQESTPRTTWRLHALLSALAALEEGGAGE